MIHDIDIELDFDDGRRTVLKGLGAAGSLSLLPSLGAAAERPEAVSDGLDPGSSARQETLIVFGDRGGIDRLETLDLEWFHTFEAFPIVWTELTGGQIADVGGWDEVRRVTENYELELENNDSQEHTNAREVWESEDLGYRGENVHAAVIDSGIDGKHPSLVGNVESNYRWVGNPMSEDPELWRDVGNANTDDLGHGSHCAGSLGGDGDGSVADDYAGMAPDVSLTAYEVFDETIYPALVGVYAVYVSKILGAYDDLITKQRAGEHDIQVVSNSWGSGPGDFDPWDPIAVAQWYAYREGMVVVFSAGNDGDDHGDDSLGVRKQAPYVMNVAAANADQSITDFSSRGKYGGNYDRQEALRNVRDVYRGVATEDLDRPIEVHRPSVAAKGGAVVSAQSPEQALYGLGVAAYGEVTTAVEEPFYVPLSGTSMACPTAAGCVSLVLDAYYEEHGEWPDPMAVINTMEATADPDAHPDDGGVSLASDRYTVINAGAGYVDAKAAVERAVADDLADFDDVELETADEPLPERYRDGIEEESAETEVGEPRPQP